MHLRDGLVPFYILCSESIVKKYFLRKYAGNNSVKGIKINKRQVTCHQVAVIPTFLSYAEMEKVIWDGFEGVWQREHVPFTLSKSISNIFLLGSQRVLFSFSNVIYYNGS